jgi:hypothetical protein
MNNYHIVKVGSILYGIFDESKDINDPEYMRYLIQVDLTV